MMIDYMNINEVNSILSKKNTKFLTVTFEKKDGSIRKVNGLLKPLSKIKGTGRGTPDGFVPIYSPYESKWSMFHKEKVLDIK